MDAFADPTLLVTTTTGVVRGAHDGNTHRWLGIPYATPPVGPLRLKAPLPAQPWEGVRDALEFGSAAPQEPTKVIPLPVGVEINEDCLNLNIWAPPRAHGDTRPRPVMFWIHGGAYFIGFSAQAVYNGRALAESGDVIVVTINYRLGALGWLDFTSFSDPADPFDSNLGMRDIVLALTWVKDNIAAFGGNPDDVTVFGESAGAGCVTTLMTMPVAEGLFHKAIAESSPATSVYKPERAAGVAQAYLDLIGVEAKDAAQRLREIDAVTLATQTTNLLNHVATTAPGTVAFAPVVDGDLIPGYPVAAFRAGKQHKVPLIIGTNHDEAALFKMMKSPLMPISESAIDEMFELVAKDNPALKGSEADIIAAYPEFPKQKGAMEISRDAGFRMPSIWVAEAHSRVAPTWMYRFDQAPPLMKLLGIGASHATELPYVFGTLPDKLSEKKALQFRLGGLKEAKEISRRIMARWLSFARTTNPVTTDTDTGLELSWPGYDEHTRTTLIINGTDTIENDPDGEIRKAWGEEILGFK
ncbi:para-nitrobenzyl esterase [Aurantimicrobium minutum]|uniref:carboxylesterase/lipase family protein n=1 Tax=Aurantimicrobium minutum TaxID=708131 RepID=UPI0024759810|nr:carboxylesterase/lipase family protein [Aurantimicrobium minutum]MDH6531960.1 para-nitrobenzyl esterase [Aurantimicrobium minutum]